MTLCKMDGGEWPHAVSRKPHLEVSHPETTVLKQPKGKHGPHVCTGVFGVGGDGKQTLAWGHR